MLIRDAAYAGTPKAARAELHQRFADWLERTGSDYEEIVGYHLEQAYRYRIELGPADAHAVELARRAGEGLGDAGKRAHLRGDMGAAANLLGRAFGLLPLDSDERFQLAPKLAWALENGGRIADADDFLTRIAEEAEGLGRTGDAMHARVERESIRFNHAQDASSERAMSLAREAMGTFEALGDDLGLARAWRLVSHDAWAACRWASMGEQLERAVMHAERAGDLGTVTELRSWIAAAEYFGPTPVPEAIARRQAVIEESAENSAQYASTLTFLGGLNAMIGNFEEGRALFRRGWDGYRELGMLVRVGGRTIVGDRIELLAGRPTAAEAILREGYEILTAMNESGLLSTVAVALAETVYLQARHDEAEELIHVSERSSAPNDASSQIGWRATRARVFARRGQLEDALHLSGEALDFVTETEDLYQQAEVLEGRAEVLEQAGRSNDARDALRETVRLFELKGATAAVERARRRLSELPRVGTVP